jgi:hypothetical protein
MTIPFEKLKAGLLANPKVKVRESACAARLLGTRAREIKPSQRRG